MQNSLYLGMLNLTENPNAVHVRNIAEYLGAELIERTDASSLSVDNENASGTIGTFHVFPGLSVWVYDITFFSDLKVALELSKENLYYFAYNLKGHFLHRFTEEGAHLTIEQNHSMIVLVNPKEGVEIIFPESVKLEISVVIVNPNLLDVTANMNALNLKRNLEKVFVKSDNKEYFRYVSGINPESARYAELIIKNDRTDLVGCLLVEGAVMNILALQISAHNRIKSKDEKKCELTGSELKKIASLGDFIKDNFERKITVSDLEKLLGMSPKKIQEGTQYLFGQSVGNYIISLRLGHAKELIRNTDLSISEICYAIGINSRSHFSKKFDERFGILPSVYKKSFKGKNALYELSYSSLLLESTDGGELKKIVREARIFNAANNITGCLAHSNGTIIQVLEGKKDMVLKLYEKIKSDKRHCNVETLWKGNIPKRNFESWSMTLVSDDLDFKRTKNKLTSKIQPEELVNKFEKSASVSRSMFQQIQKVINANLYSADKKIAG